MNKLQIISAGALFFVGGMFYGQQVSDTATRDIDEVVVVGYGTQKKREVTGAISQVKGEEISKLVAPSFDSQLAGRAAGVQITQPSGLIGEAPRIRIRGINSISSSTYPLIVVDGIPIFTGDTGGYAANNALSDINPSDIESYEVLKDGAATAVYGSRAANGVILITTKRGKMGKASISYNNYFGVASAAKRFDLLETPDFITISNEKRSNRGFAAWAAGTEYNTDWQGEVFRNASQMDHNLNMNGGFAKGSYYTSFGYTQQEGIVKANNMNRFTARMNADQKVFSWLKVGTSIGVTNTKTNGLNTGSNSLSGAAFNVIRQLPNTPVYDPAGPFGYNIATVGTNTMVGRWKNNEYIANNLPNIVYVLDHNKLQSNVTRIIGNIYTEMDLLQDLKLRVQASVDRADNEGFLYWNSFHGDGRSSNGRVQNNTTKLNRYNWQNVLTYDKTFGAHSITLTGVNEYQKQDVNSFFGAATDLSDSFYNKNIISGSFGTHTTGGAKSDNALTSLLGRVNYDFAKKYFLQASLRRDKLSKFAEENREGIFPGISAGWTISNEDFMKSNESISDLKLRASWGKVGNTEIGSDYPYLSLYSPVKYGATNGLAYSQMGNKDLSWETSTKTDIGFDMAFKGNRYRFTADYFINNIDNLILDVPLAPSLGVPGNSYKDNIGVSRNSGLELSFDATPVKTQDFELTFNTNLSLVDNVVKKIYEGRDLVYENNIVREGEPIYSLYGVKYYGVNPANGNPVYHQTDGTYVQADYVTNSYRVFDPNNPGSTATAGKSPDTFLLGNVLPKYFGGITMTMRYKNFDFNTLGRFSGGNHIMNVTRRELLSQFFNNNSTEILGRWQSADNPGDGWTPKLWSSSDPLVNGPTMANSRFVEKGDFFKLDNVTFGYNFDQNWLNTVNIQKMRIFLQAQNALILTGYKGLDPEMEVTGVDYNGTPRQKVYSFGVNLTL